MGNVVSVIARLVIALIGGAWAYTLVLAETTCPLILRSMLHPCTGSGEIWMLPIFTGAIGLPAFTAAVVIVLAAVLPKRAP